MSRIIRSSLLLGVAVLSLAACASDKGPGEIGSKDDIVVRNNGMPQAKQAEAAPAPAPQTGDFSSTVEQGEAIPAPQVAAAEPLPDNSPAMEQAVAAQEAATAPLPSTPTSDATNSAVPADPRQRTHSWRFPPPRGAAPPPLSRRHRRPRLQPRAMCIRQPITARRFQHLLLSLPQRRQHRLLLLRLSHLPQRRARPPFRPA